MKTVLSLSGGMDSATLLGILLEQGNSVCPVIFTYGSKHNAYENESAWQLFFHYRKLTPLINQPIHLDLRMGFSSMKSNLMLSGNDIPEGHYAEESMKKTVVPGRNTIFIAYMLGIAESINADIICLGVHSGDHHIYPDCRLSYINHMRVVVKEASEGKIDLIAPLIQDDKTSIIKQGLELKVPYELTRTCYKDQAISCGKCGSCNERLEAFANNQIKDPIQYE